MPEKQKRYSIESAMQSIKKRNVYIVALTGLFAAVISPFLYYSWQKYLVNYFETVADMVRTAANFNIAGYFVPWKYVLFGLAFIAAGFYFKVGAISLSEITSIRL